MNSFDSDASLRSQARLAGLLYLLVAAGAGFAQFAVHSSVLVPGDAAATAAKILSSERLYRIGIIAEIIAYVCDIALAILLFRLFRYVNVTVALLTAAFRLAMAITLTVNLIHSLEPLLLLGSAEYLGAIPEIERHAHVLTGLRLHAQIYSVAMIFFGVFCLLTAYLIYRSTFLPRWIGLAMAVGGAGYLLNSFFNLLAPGLASELGLFPWILLPSAIGEFSLILWLLIKGINTARWKVRANENRMASHLT